MTKKKGEEKKEKEMEGNSFFPALVNNTKYLIFNLTSIRKDMPCKIIEEKEKETFVTYRFRLVVEDEEVCPDFGRISIGHSFAVRLAISASVGTANISGSEPTLIS